jgi:hypothetical protein
MDQKTEVSGIYKVREGVLINKDNDALKIYKTKKQRERRIDEIQNDVMSLKDDIQEIKQLLKGLAR